MFSARIGNSILSVCAAACISLLPLCAAEAGGYRLAYSFSFGADGALPTAGMIADASGNLYGTASSGGNGCDCGSVFELQADGTFLILHDFTGDDGDGPQAPLIIDKKGNLFGTTFNGGIRGRNGAGTVFKLAPDGTETVLYAFSGSADGGNPAAGLLMDGKGNLYGTAETGGANGYGVVFEVTAAGAYKVLYSFNATPDGQTPAAGLVRDKAGNLYGTTQSGGDSGGGTVFKLAPDGAETIIHAFGSGSDGSKPLSSLLFRSGNLYGTTCAGGIGAGTIFKLARDGTETILHNFAGPADGICPSANLIADRKGNLYGTTAGGGQGEVGTVFQLTPSGTLNVLHTFEVSHSDGAQSFGGLVMLGHHLYGTTFLGGQNDLGTIFRLRN
jgi:uncharacterized repeat protein (TIGR03803 family)